MSFSCLIFLLLLLIQLQINNAEEYKTYIIHVNNDHKPTTFSTHESWHKSILQSLSSSPSAAHDDDSMLLYSYNHVMRGFSAKLTPSQLSELEESPAHVATYPESFGKLFTTRSPQFLGLQHNFGLWPAASYGEGVIIGVVDTGIWPESESFSDQGMSQVPKRWKGACDNGTAFSPSLCNKKLVGARSFSKGLKAAGKNISTEDDYDSPRDFLGHGTHTSSTAAGNIVLGVSQFGYAKGTARGVAPRAHIAMYKAIWSTSDSSESATSDVLAAMDQAISDGVDIISLSLGFHKNGTYLDDVIAIASLSATEKGIVVIAAAGNDGEYKSIYNGAPWITTVGASTLDRTLTARLALENGLDNGLTVEGESYFPDNIYIADKPLYYAQDDANKAACYNGTLDPNEVAGKVVFCDKSTTYGIDGQKDEVKRAGAFAAIFVADRKFLDPNFYTIPVMVVPSTTGVLIREYVTKVNNTTKVKSFTFVHTNLGTKPAPMVADFSSRGPDSINPGVLKPDIIAPGVDVLAAVPPNIAYMTGLNGYGLVTDYALYSGTSMATPHVAGVAALLKAVRLDWSPAAIRSAIMTTAYTKDNTQTTIKEQRYHDTVSPLDFGAGHIDPNKAMDPGLIYDMEMQDYIEFLCNLGYNATQMSSLIRRSQWSCNAGPTELNYPSFTALFNGSDSPGAKSFSRVVTNVGNGTSVYRAVVEVPSGMKIAVKPNTLTFSGRNQKQGFVLSLEVDSTARGKGTETTGYVKWIDQHNHIVASPVVVINLQLM